MFEAIGSVLTGGLTGIVGTVATGALSIWRAKQQHAHDMDARRLEIQEMRLEAERADRQMAHETALAETEAAGLALQASYAEAGARYSEGDSQLLHLADFIRALVRPVLLLLLMGLSAAIFFTSDDAGIREQITATVLYLTTAAGTWYFGGRQLSKGVAPR